MSEAVLEPDFVMLNWEGRQVSDALAHHFTPMPAKVRNLAPDMRYSVETARIKMRMTTTELAAATSIPLATLEQIESGFRTADVHQAKALSNVLRINLVLGGVCPRVPEL